MSTLGTFVGNTYVPPRPVIGGMTQGSFSGPNGTYIAPTPVIGGFATNSGNGGPRRII
jgi:hypothetical protein